MKNKTETSIDGLSQSCETECECDCHDRPPNVWDAVIALAAVAMPISMIICMSQVFIALFEAKK